MTEPLFLISKEPIDTSALKEKVLDERAGACAIFEGWVRNHNDGKAVESLQYDVFAELAIKEGERIVQEVLAKYDVHAGICVHRVGLLSIGDIAITCVVTSSHRKAAFDACQEIVDQVKARVPVWKKEWYVDGQSEWIDPTAKSIDQGA